jgi:hypothetical protein
MFHSQPEDKFVKVEVRFRSIEIMNCCENSTSDDTSMSFQSRGWPGDRTITLKVFLPTIKAGHGDKKGIRNILVIPATIPESQSTLFQVRTDSSVDHNDIGMKNDGYDECGKGFLIRNNVCHVQKKKFTHSHYSQKAL